MIAIFHRTIKLLYQIWWRSKHNLLSFISATSTKSLNFAAATLTSPPPYPFSFCHQRLKYYPIQLVDIHSQCPGVDIKDVPYCRAIVAKQEEHCAGTFRSEHDDELDGWYWHYLTYHWSSGWTIKSESRTTVCHTTRECWVSNFFCFYCFLSSSSSTDLPYPNR